MGGWGSGGPPSSAWVGWGPGGPPSSTRAPPCPLPACLPTCWLPPVASGYACGAGSGDQGHPAGNARRHPPTTPPTPHTPPQRGHLTPSSVPAFVSPAAALQGGISWLVPGADGVPTLGWHDTIAYLVLPVLLVVSQYISQVGFFISSFGGSVVGYDVGCVGEGVGMRDGGVFISPLLVLGQSVHLNRCGWLAGMAVDPLTHPAPPPPGAISPPAPGPGPADAPCPSPPTPSLSAPHPTPHTPSAESHLTTAAGPGPGQRPGQRHPQVHPSNDR